MVTKKKRKKSKAEKAIIKGRCMNLMSKKQWDQLETLLDRNLWLFDINFKGSYDNKKDCGVMDLLFLYEAKDSLISKYTNRKHHSPLCGIYHYGCREKDDEMLDLIERYFNNQLHYFISEFNDELPANVSLGVITEEEAKILEDKFNLYKMLIDILSNENKYNEFYDLARNEFLLSSLKTGFVSSYQDIETIINNPVQQRKNISSII